jgi:hypothetical protein
MSNAEIITLIDAMLAGPVSNSTKKNLRSFRAQVQAGTIAEDDRNYIINLCKRLQPGKDESRQPSVRSEKDDERAREDAEAREKRIKYQREAGHFFESNADMKWLYFDLTLRGVLEKTDEEKETDDIVSLILPGTLQKLRNSPSHAEEELKELVRKPIWESLWWDAARGRSRIDDLTEQAARYIDRPLFHCTALRDFFILRLMGSLPQLVGDDPIPRKRNWKARVLLCICVLTAVPFIWIYVNWWSAALVLVFLWFLARRWEAQYENNANNRWSSRHYSKHFTQEAIFKLIERVRQGGFDEPTLIEQLELLDVTKTAPNSAVPLSASGAPIRAPLLRPTVLPIPIPDVLYALLRLPRRNVQNELLVKFSALDEQKRDELMRRWCKFVDQMLTYDEPQPNRL